MTFGILDSNIETWNDNFHVIFIKFYIGNITRCNKCFI